jgi:bifunctional non-homologous end joining protein LigD
MWFTSDKSYSRNQTRRRSANLLGFRQARCRRPSKHRHALAPTCYRRCALQPIGDSTLGSQPLSLAPMSASRELKRLELCLPRPAKAPPAGPGWIHEIKHDGFRILAERDPKGVTLHTRRGYDFADRFPLAAAAVAKLPVKSCLIDGEAIVCDANGLAVFDLLRRHWHGEDVILCAFDLIELDGRDMRLAPIEERKAALAKLLRRSIDGIAFNEHYSGDGAIIYKHACALGCEGIVSKRLGSAYRGGRTGCWVKVKNPAAPAVTREAEEDWNGKRQRR